MIKGFAQRRIDKMGWEIALIDRENKKSYSVEFRMHELKDGQLAEVSFINYEGMELAKALADALTEMGVLSSDATTAELKATKYHLEDFRKLVFK